MDDITKNLVFLLLQYFNEESLKETALTLARESGIYFDLKHFETMVLKGQWDEAENYLSAFTKLEDNDYSAKIFFEIRKQKYLEALDSNDRDKSLDILLNDLKVFASINNELYKQLTQLLTFQNIREAESLANYKDAYTMRKKMVGEVKKVIEHHPLLKGKLQFPAIQTEMLRKLIT